MDSLRPVWRLNGRRLLSPQVPEFSTRTDRRKELRSAGRRTRGRRLKGWRKKPVEPAMVTARLNSVEDFLIGPSWGSSGVFPQLDFQGGAAGGEHTRLPLLLSGNN